LEYYDSYLYYTDTDVESDAENHAQLKNEAEKQ
jgi:hypothetical protein